MKYLFIVILIFNSLVINAATKYWFGTANTSDAANWASDTTSWTVTTAPTISDDIRFTKAAGNVTCTVNSSVSCLNLICSGFTGTITGSSSYWFDIRGSVTCGGTMTFAGFYIMNAGGSTNQSFTTNGVSLSGHIKKDNSSGTLTFQDNISTTGRLEIVKGTVNTNSKTCSFSYIVISSSANPSALTCGSSSITLTSSSGIDFETNGSNFTFTCGTSTIHLTSTSSSTKFYGNGKTFYNVYFDGTTGGGTISGSNTFTELKLSPSTAKTYKFTDGTTQTVTTFTATGSPGKNITLTGTSTGGWTISKSSGTVSCDYLNIQYSTATGGATWSAGYYSVNRGSNSGWTFKAASPYIQIIY